MNNFAFPPDIEAELAFVKTEDGGRKSPVSSGYRPQFFYDHHDWDATHEYPDVEQVFPGQTVRTFLRFLSPAVHKGKLSPGLIFQIREGVRVVAQCRVTKILSLAESVRRAEELK